MKVHSISIRNILGIEALEFTPGSITRITGGNDAGKTSVLEAIKAVAKGGKDATLLRTGQTKGEVVIELEGGMQISRRITPNGSYLDVTKDGAKVAKPAEVLQRLWDSLSANPIQFMKAGKKDRIDWLLEQVDAAPVIAKLEQIAPNVRTPPASNALAAMDHAHKMLYDLRTAHNRDAKKADDTAEVLAQDLPPESGDVAADLSEAKAEHHGYSAGMQAELDRARAETADRLHELAEVEEEEIEALRRKIEEVRANAAKMAAIERGKQEAEMAKIRAETEPKIEAAAAEVSRLTEAQRVADEAAGRRKLLADTKAESANARKQSEKLTIQLKAVEKLKAEVLQALPIPGVEIIDGDIHKDGVPFDRLNTATQWAIAIGIAKSRAGDIPLICADGLEALDDENFAAFSGMAAESGLHFIVTDRGNGPLAVDTEGKREAAQ